MGPRNAHRKPGGAHMVVHHIELVQQQAVCWRQVLHHQGLGWIEEGVGGLVIGLAAEASVHCRLCLWSICFTRQRCL